MLSLTMMISCELQTSAYISRSVKSSNKRNNEDRSDNVEKAKKILSNGDSSPAAIYDLNYENSRILNLAIFY
jgi:hypothetical protein